jgi:hypothetical protein
MFNTDAQQEFKDTLKEFSRKNYKIYGSDSYTAGYYESLVVAMFNSLSKKAQKELLKDMQYAVAKPHTV